MNTALVCCAKNEDHYIDEWLEYHLKLGFSDIFVYQNDWRYPSGGIFAKNPQVHFKEMDGNVIQLRSYDTFIMENAGQFDWAGFYDVDEFLDLHIDRNVEDFLTRFSDEVGVHVNCRLYGDSGHSHAPGASETWSLLKRFTRRQRDFDRHVKTFLNLKRIPPTCRFVNPHFANIQTIDTTGCRGVFGPYDYEPIYPIAQLNHYYCKTIEEFINIKIPKGKADTPTMSPAYFRRMDEFAPYNRNEVLDTHARDFFLS